MTGTTAASFSGRDQKLVALQVRVGVQRDAGEVANPCVCLDGREEATGAESCLTWQRPWRCRGRRHTTTRRSDGSRMKSRGGKGGDGGGCSPRFSGEGGGLGVRPRRRGRVEEAASRTAPCTVVDEVDPGGAPGSFVPPAILKRSAVWFDSCPQQLPTRAMAMSR